MRHRVTVVIDPELAAEALDLYRRICELVRDEGYEPDECVTAEYERTSWEPVYVPSLSDG